VEEIPDSDKRFLVLLPMLANWIETNRKLSEREMDAFIRQYPGHFGTAVDLPVDDMIAMLSKYENHPFYGRGIKIAQSSEGKKWLREFYLQAREVAKSLK